MGLTVFLKIFLKNKNEKSTQNPYSGNFSLRDWARPIARPLAHSPARPASLAFRPLTLAPDRATARPTDRSPTRPSARRPAQSIGIAGERRELINVRGNDGERSEPMKHHRRKILEHATPKYSALPINPGSRSHGLPTFPFFNFKREAAGRLFQLHLVA